MTPWLIFLLFVAFCLTMLLAMLRGVDRALEEADLEIRRDWLWDDIESQAADKDSGRVRVPAIPACVVCDDAGCPHCPRVVA